MLLMWHNNHRMTYSTNNLNNYICTKLTLFCDHTNHITQTPLEATGKNALLKTRFKQNIRYSCNLHLFENNML